MNLPLLLAQGGTNAGDGNLVMYLIIIAVLAAMMFFSFILLVSSSYKRCPSNRVLVIYGWVGKGSTSKTIHGGASWVIPLFQNYSYLSLEPIQIEVPLRGALSIENIRVNVPSVFTVAIGTKPDMMQNAAIRLLGLNSQEIRKQAEEIIFGQLRQVIASMRIEDINRDRDTFLDHIQRSLEPELKKIGLELINVNITDITDESGYIDAIGQKAASTAIQQARGDVADQEKLGEVRVADADREKAVLVASATKDKQIGTRAAQREQAVRIAEMDDQVHDKVAVASVGSALGQ
jgi:flotillin